MDFNLDVRLKQLQSLENYISSSWGKVNSVLDRLHWDAKDVLKDNHLIKCSVDPNHRIHIHAAEEHIKKCSLRKDGYLINEQFLSEPQHNPSSIYIDDHKKIDILSNAHRTIPNFKSGWNGQDPDPKTSDRLISTFSSEERSVLYNYAIENTQGPPKLPDFKVVEPPKHCNELTYEELMLLERDMKRRRIKYKGVFTNRKNYTEVLREVIDGQMELYKSFTEGSEEPMMAVQEDSDSQEIVVSKRNHSEMKNRTRSSSKSSSLYSKSYKDNDHHYKEYDRHDYKDYDRTDYKDYDRHDYKNSKNSDRRDYRDYDRRNNKEYDRRNYKDYDHRDYKDYDHNYKKHRDKYKSHKSRRHERKRHNTDLHDDRRESDHYDSHKKR